MVKVRYQYSHLGWALQEALIALIQITPSGPDSVCYFNKTSSLLVMLLQPEESDNSLRIFSRKVVTSIGFVI